MGLDLLASSSIMLEVFQESAEISTRVLSTMFLYVSCKCFPYQEYRGSGVNDGKYTHGVWVQVPGSATCELCNLGHAFCAHIPLL